MRILQIDDVFHPDAGYNENIISKYFIQKGHDTAILTSELDKIPNNLVGFFGKDGIEERDSEYTRKYGVSINRLPIYTYISGRSIYHAKQLAKTIIDYDPDILYIHGNDTWVAIWCIKHNKLFRAKIVTDSHMLDMAGRNPLRRYFHSWYRKYVTPIIIENNIPVIRIQNDDYVERRLGIPLKQAPLISVGSDTILFHPDKAIRRDFRKAHSISEEAFVFLYAGKMDESKGGRLLAETLVKKFESRKPVVFMVVGNTTGTYGMEVEALFRESNNVVIRFHTQKYSNLASFYQAADVALFPKQCSLSFYDVQACGLPVVFEDNKINIARSHYGNAIQFRSGDKNDFRRAIQTVLDMSDIELKEMSQVAIKWVKKDYDYKNISECYLKIFEKCLKATN